MSIVCAKDLVKVYSAGDSDVKALKGVSFSIDEAALVSFIGPSGSGKTTLLNIIGCLDKATEGSIEVAGRDTSLMSRKEAAVFRGENIGFIFQDFNLIPVLTVFENVEYPLLMVKNMKPAERKERVNALLEAVGMTEYADKYPHSISGGQKQRTAVARALVARPAVVLADEPTANLDTETAHMVISLMKKMKDEYKTTFIFSTHDERVVNEVEVIYNLRDGQIESRTEV